MSQVQVLSPLQMKNLQQVKLGGGIFIQEAQGLKGKADEVCKASARSFAAAAARVRKSGGLSQDLASSFVSEV